MHTSEPQMHPLFLDTHPGIREAYETMTVAGQKFRFLDGELEPGDTYMAERNTGVKVLTVFEVKNGYVVPQEMGYCFNTGECFKIALIKGE